MKAHQAINPVLFYQFLSSLHATSNTSTAIAPCMWELCTSATQAATFTVGVNGDVKATPDPVNHVSWRVVSVTKRSCAVWSGNLPH